MAGRTVGVSGVPVQGQVAGPVARANRALRTPLGDEGYLWLLVALELAATYVLRRKFRNAHGG
jgi:hypothetical protein